MEEFTFYPHDLRPRFYRQIRGVTRACCSMARVVTRVRSKWTYMTKQEKVQREFQRPKRWFPKKARGSVTHVWRSSRRTSHRTGSEPRNSRCADHAYVRAMCYTTPCIRRVRCLRSPPPMAKRSRCVYRRRGTMRSVSWLWYNIWRVVVIQMRCGQNW